MNMKAKTIGPVIEITTALRPPRHIKTAEEVVASIDHQAKVQKKLSAEVEEFRRKQAEQENYEDLRDDVVSVLRNSGRSFEYIHANFGPTEHTLTRWINKQVSRPQLGKMQSALRAVGFDIGVIDHIRRRQG